MSVAAGVAANDLWLNPKETLWASMVGQNDSTANGENSATGDAIQYRFGVVQLKVTKSGDQLVKIEEVQATASRGYEQAFPYLNQYALEANGSSFGNLSGATYSTEAYRAALDSALAKLG